MKLIVPATVLTLAALYAPALLAVDPGDTLPEVDAKIREIIPADKEATLQKGQWQGLAELNGENKVYTLYHLAPRMGIDNLHKPYFDLVETSGITAGHQTITIVNLDEAVWGTAGMAVSELKKGAIENPGQRFILDKHSAFKQAWQIEDNTAAIILVDNQGSVLGVHNGEITAEQAQPLVELLKQQLQQ